MRSVCSTRLESRGTREGVLGGALSLDVVEHEKGMGVTCRRDDGAAGRLEDDAGGVDARPHVPAASPPGRASSSAIRRTPPSAQPVNPLSRVHLLGEFPPGSYARRSAPSVTLAGAVVFASSDIRHTASLAPEPPEPPPTFVASRPPPHLTHLFSLDMRTPRKECPVYWGGWRCEGGGGERWWWCPWLRDRAADASTLCLIPSSTSSAAA